ncbi:uncharacterized protein LOC128296640 [Gossypium arboreum]|uniref:uncharacterized protein LOC128296640 n=1 Tax=Gossypium arboreum TaxID=29729 RepID=UPI0022F14CCA|nr:uncharacterized protein LOC128296640 [Gossypium arboreum]
MVPVVEEYSILWRCPMTQVDKVYSRANYIPTFVRKLMNVIGRGSELKWKEQEGKGAVLEFLPLLPLVRLNVVSNQSRIGYEEDCSTLYGKACCKEKGSHDRVVGDDALSQAMLRVLERVAGASTGSVGWGGASGVAPNVAEYLLETTTDCLTWDFFKAAFSGKYVGVSYVDARRKEFLNLIQGNKTVAEYEAEFLRLSRFACRIVATKYERYVRFEEGLRDELRVLIVPKRERDFAALVEKAKIIDDVKRSERQNREKDKCKNKRDFQPSSSSGRPVKRARFDGPILAIPGIVVRPQPCANYGRTHQGECWKRTGAYFRCGLWILGLRTARGGNGFGRGHEAPDRGAGNTKVRQPALVYVARRLEDGDASNVITGTFLIYNLPYTTLIDTGFTYSYVACTIFEMLGIQSKNIVSEMTVLSPLGQPIGVSKLFRDVPLEVQGVVFSTDLMELSFEEFDIILGMDWLVKQRAKLDCAAKRMVLKSKEDEEVTVIGERRDYLSNVISMLRAEKLVRKGYEVFLAYVSISDSKGPSLGDVRIVKEFLDVFLKELLGLPPDREVEFSIEFLPRTAPESIGPYRMAPKELVELKAQI